MTVVTVGELLQRARDFERRLEASYADLRDRATDDGVRMLTYYLARHRRHLPEALESFSQRQLELMEHVPRKYDDSEFRPEKCFSGMPLPSSATGDELLTVAIESVETLISFYRWMVRQPLGNEAAALFQSLLRIEETHVIELKKTKAMHYF